MVAHNYHSNPLRMRQKDCHEFEASLYNRVRLCLERKKGEREEFMKDNQ